MQKLFTLLLLTTCLAATSQTAFKYPINGTAYFILLAPEEDIFVEVPKDGDDGKKISDLQFNFNKIFKDGEIANRIAPFKFEQHLRVNDLAFDIIIVTGDRIEIPSGISMGSGYGVWSSSKYRIVIIINVIQPDGNTLKLALRDTLDYFSDYNVNYASKGNHVVKNREAFLEWNEKLKYGNLYFAHSEELTQAITDRIKTLLLSIPKNAEAAKKMAGVKENMQNTYRNDTDLQAAFKRNWLIYQLVERRIDQPKIKTTLY